MKNIKKYNIFINEAKIQMSDFVNICVELSESYNKFNIEASDLSVDWSDIQILEDFLKLIKSHDNDNYELTNSNDTINIDYVTKKCKYFSLNEKDSILKIYSKFKLLENEMPLMEYIEDRFMVISDEYTIEITKYFETNNFKYLIEFAHGKSPFDVKFLKSLSKIDEYHMFFSNIKHIFEIIRLEYPHIEADIDIENSLIIIYKK